MGERGRDTQHRSGAPRVMKLASPRLAPRLEPSASAFLRCREQAERPTEDKEGWRAKEWVDKTGSRRRSLGPPDKHADSDRGSQLRTTPLPKGNKTKEGRPVISSLHAFIFVAVRVARSLAPSLAHCLAPSAAASVAHWLDDPVSRSNAEMPLSETARENARSDYGCIRAHPNGPEIRVPARWPQLTAPQAYELRARATPETADPSFQDERFHWCWPRASLSRSTHKFLSVQARGTLR